MTSAKRTFLLSLLPFGKSNNKLLAHTRQDLFQRKIEKKHAYPTKVKYEKFEDTKEVIRRCKLKEVKKHNGQKGQTMIYKTLHRLTDNIEQHIPH